MTRTGLDDAWVRSVALAAAYIESQPGHADDVKALLARYQDAAMGLADLGALEATPGPDPYTLAVESFLDLADALVDLCAEPQPIEGFTLTFVNADDGRLAAPEDFTHDEAGRAVIWGSQLAVAATAGHRDTADAMVAMLAEAPMLDAAYRLLCFINGVAHILRHRYHVDAGDARTVEALGGEPVTYTAQCSDCAKLIDWTSSREHRDGSAAWHTFRESHAVTRGEM
jgi:hypothetical protein